MKICRISQEDKYCFFGYYDKYATDSKDKYHLFHQVDFQDRVPSENDKARICICEIKRGKVEVIDETYAWNFQQGSMLQWFNDKKIIYNYRKEKKFVSKIYNLNTGKTEYLPKPIYALSPDRKYALSTNFSRLAKWRPGYGYKGIEDEFKDIKWPEKDGIYLIDIEKGESELIIPLALMLEFRKEKNIKESYAWFNHLLFSPDSERFIFLNRWWKENESTHRTRLLTSDKDGKEIYDLIDSYTISHFEWKNKNEIIVWAEVKGKEGFWLVEDRTGKIKKISDKMQTIDGHCSFSKDERFILYDTYPINNFRYLKLYDIQTDKEKILGKFYSIPVKKDEIRCDLHPRWGRKGKFVSFDSTHEGYRGVYIVEIDEKEIKN